MLRLHSLSISRFRGIREGTIQNFADVNVLIGRNNSGKTTVVEAIMRVAFGRYMPEDMLGRPVFHIWEMPRNATGDNLSELWYNQDQSQPICLTAEVEESSHRTQPVLTTLITMEGDKRNLNCKHDRKEVPEGVTESHAAIFYRGIGLFRPLDARDKEIESKLWPQLIGSRRDKVLTQAVNAIFKLGAEGLQLLPGGRLVVLYPDKSLPLDVQGDGTRSTLRSLMIFAAIRRSAFLIEEPECHQHPGSLERYAATLCKLAREQEVQLIATTHSAECVRAFLKAAKEAKSESAVFHLKLEDGLLDARRLDAQAAATLEESGVDLRFLDLYA